MGASSESSLPSCSVPSVRSVWRRRVRDIRRPASFPTTSFFSPFLSIDRSSSLTILQLTLGIDPRHLPAIFFPFGDLNSLEIPEQRPHFHTGFCPFVVRASLPLPPHQRSSCLRNKSTPPASYTPMAPWLPIQRSNFTP